jgi:hypothetical protein
VKRVKDIERGRFPKVASFDLDSYAQFGLKLGEKYIVKIND